MEGWHAMRCVIQTIPSRLAKAEAQSKALGLPCDLYVDTLMEGPFKAFIKTFIAIPYLNEYRFHMQDDLILADGLSGYLPSLERKMQNEGMHYLSLYSTPRKVFTDAHKNGLRFIKAPVLNYLHLQCVMFSPWLCSKLVEHAGEFDPNNRADDVYLANIIRAYKIPAYYHIPSLVQHDISMPSSVGYVNNKMRTSPIFDKHFMQPTQQ
jgi:hypothetical protein